MEASTSPLSVGSHVLASQTRSAAAVHLPGHRGTTASPRSALAMLCVRRAVVASIEGAESSPNSSVYSPSGGAPYWRAQVQVCGPAPLSQPTVLLAMMVVPCGPPPQRQLSPRTHRMASRWEKLFQERQRGITGPRGWPRTVGHDH